MIIKVTQHARKRLSQRIKDKSKKHIQIAHLAYYKGTPASKVGNAEIFDYLSKVQGDKLLRVHQFLIFIFTKEDSRLYLITVIPLPKKYRIPKHFSS